MTACGETPQLQTKPRRLLEEGEGIFVNDFIDLCGGVFAAFHFERAFWYRHGIGYSPVTGRVHPDAIRAVSFEDIDRTVWGAFAFWIKCHACPEAGIHHQLHCVFFNVVNDDFRVIQL